VEPQAAQDRVAAEVAPGEHDRDDADERDRDKPPLLHAEVDGGHRPTVPEQASRVGDPFVPNA
jgi:hypothetical protein